MARSGGAVPFGCNIYRAESPPIAERKCSPYQTCGTYPGRHSKIVVDDFKKVAVVEHGVVKGAVNMKKEIYKRGPISCAIQVTDNFYFNYRGGVYSEKLWMPSINHAIAVVGWGVETQEGGQEQEYWIVRNSWGTMWGESGYFRIKMYEDNLGIESGCAWAVPKPNF